MKSLPPDREYMIRHEGRTFGPYSRADLEAGARDGKITHHDEVCDAATQKWVPAHKVEWLVGPRGRRLPGGGTPGWIVAVAVLLVLAGVVAFFVLKGKGGAQPDTAGTTDPDPSTVVATETWGPVPAGRLNVRLRAGSSRADADQVAAAVGGTVVDELPFLDLYMIDLPATTEAELRAALDVASARDEVAGAFPEQLAVLYVRGKACTPLEDPAYEGRLSRPQEMIGVQRAWSLLKAASLPLNAVKVGILDDGLHVGQGEFDGAATIETPGTRDELAQPDMDSGGKPLDWYSHGTAVASVIAADEDDGGVVGIASPLGDKLSVTMANKFYKGFQGLVPTAPPKKGAPQDPTIVTEGKASYVISNLAIMKQQVDGGAKVINLSWGMAWDAKKKKLRETHPLIYKAYKDFFTKMAAEKKDVVFVCAAGNESTTPNDGKHIPSGFDLPNVITVGNLNNEGGTQGTGTNVMAKGKSFKVDIAAPGARIVHGVGPDGAVVASDGGTSMATPQVVATIALMKSLDPQLTCSQIKEILRDTARKTIEKTDGTKATVPANVGGRCLAVDRAVLEVINRRREKLGLPERLTLDALLELAHVALEATEDADGDWVVVASVPKVQGASTTLTIRPEQAAGIGGATLVTVQAGETARWVVTPQGATRVHVERGDTGACWSVLIGGIQAVVQASPPSGAGSGQVPLEVAVSARASESVHGAIVTYEWDLDGDGSFEHTTARPDAPQTLKLSVPGAYRVTVRVTDETGETDVATTTIRVAEPVLGDKAARIAKLRTLLQRERTRKKEWLERIAAATLPPSPDRRPMPDIHKADREFIRDVIQPEIDRLERELRALGASR